MKWMDVAVAFVILVGFLLFINSMTILPVYKLLLYIIVLIFLGSWIGFILRS